MLLRFVLQDGEWLELGISYDILAVNGRHKEEKMLNLSLVNKH